MVQTLKLHSFYPWFSDGWSIYITYPALAMTLAVSTWDLVSPVKKRCNDKNCVV